MSDAIMDIEEATRLAWSIVQSTATGAGARRGYGELTTEVLETRARLLGAVDPLEATGVAELIAELGRRGYDAIAREPVRESTAPLEGAPAEPEAGDDQATSLDEWLAAGPAVRAAAAEAAEPRLLSPVREQRDRAYRIAAMVAGRVLTPEDADLVCPPWRDTSQGRAWEQQSGG